MDLKITAVAVILFFVLTPTVLVRLPSGGNKYVVAGTHALVFGILFHLMQTFMILESFVEGGRYGPPPRGPPPVYKPPSPKEQGRKDLDGLCQSYAQYGDQSAQVCRDSAQGKCMWVAGDKSKNTKDSCIARQSKDICADKHKIRSRGKPTINQAVCERKDEDENLCKWSSGKCVEL